MAPVHWKVLEKIFVTNGFKLARQEGSHRAYVKPGISRPVVIPIYDEVPVSIKTAGISREEFLALLKDAS
ncbi:MAG: type II toxin-antitoxin system HicA family toxin [Desulfobaccales bacterium]